MVRTIIENELIRVTRNTAVQQFDQGHKENVKYESQTQDFFGNMKNLITMVFK